jgi:hypothetical protein
MKEGRKEFEVGPSVGDAVGAAVGGGVHTWRHTHDVEPHSSWPVPPVLKTNMPS